MPSIQSSQNVFQHQSHPANGPRPPGGVWQDKTAPQRDRIASTPPASLNNGVRPHSLNTTSSRSQKRSSKRQTVSLTLWVKPSLKAELQRLAAAEGISVSKIGTAFLEEAIRQKLHVQHAVLLQPIIEQAIRTQMRGMSTRLAWLLVRVAFDSGQTRSLVTNILGRQPGVTPIGADLRIMSSQKAECARAKENGSPDEPHPRRPVWVCSPAQTAMDRALATDALTVGRLLLVFLLSLLLSRSCRLLQHDGYPLSRAC